MYLALRHRTWWALHSIPLDAQAVLGRRRFAQSLMTADRAVAEDRAALLEPRWRALIARILKSEREAAFLKSIARKWPKSKPKAKRRKRRAA
jgi:hypothetical protein